MDVGSWRRAIAAAPRAGLDALSKDVWAAYGTGLLSDVEAGELCEMIAGRRAIPAAAPPAPRRTGSRARSPASVERRRAWAASSWLPPRIAARFTSAEQAALGVVLSTIALSGSCELCHGAVAGRAGVSVSTVKRALGEARKLGLIAVAERRLTWARSLPNVVTVLSPELKTWVATRGRGLRAAKQMWDTGEGFSLEKPRSPTSTPSTSPASQATRDRAIRWDGRTGNAMKEKRAPAIEKSTAGHLRASWGGIGRRRVL